MDASSLLPFLNVGVAGVILVAFIFGWIVPKWVYDDRVKECHELRVSNENERKLATSALAEAAATRDILIALRGDSRYVAPPKA
jgi:hypothetical protein